VVGLLTLAVLAGCGEEAASDGAPGEGDGESPPTLADGEPTRSGPDDPSDGVPGRLVGSWKRARPRAEELTDAQREEAEALSAIGYAAGVRAADGVSSGVTVHDAERAHPGLNLVVSGHRAEAVLMDMDGRPLHAWHRDFADSWPGRSVPATNAHQHFWRRAELLPDGHLLAIHEGLGLVRLDERSRLVWTYDGGVHHDIDALDDGTVLVLTRRAGLVERIHPDRPILEDFLTWLDDGGRELRSLSLLECAERSPFWNLFEEGMARYFEKVAAFGGGDETEGGNLWGDVFHTNSVQRLGGALEETSRVFAAGHVLVSVRNLDLLAIVDPDEGQVVWARRGTWRAQHEPVLLDGGTLLLFDNMGTPRRSAVLEIDPLTGDVLWSYRADEPDVFYSQRAGSVQRLPNGNTLVVESNAGRAFELTPAKDVVWEFLNPFRAGERGELVANLFDLVRLPADFPTDWLEE